MTEIEDLAYVIRHTNVNGHTTTELNYTLASFLSSASSTRELLQIDGIPFPVLCYNYASHLNVRKGLNRLSTTPRTRSKRHNSQKAVSKLWQPAGSDEGFCRWADFLCRISLSSTIQMFSKGLMLTRRRHQERHGMGREMSEQSARVRVARTTRVRNPGIQSAARRLA